MPVERSVPATHRARAIRFLETWSHAGWTVKIYGIRQDDERPASDLVDAAKRLASSTLPTPAIAPDRYGAAFVTIHQAALFHSILVQWWERDNELRIRVFRSYAAAPLEFREITASGEIACVWELRIMAFERDAWLGSVAGLAPAPDWEGYFAARLDEDS